MRPTTAPSIQQVKARARLDHMRLRDLLDTLEGSLQGPNGSNESPTCSLTDAVWRLFLALDDHLHMEERDLVPYLRETRGTAAVERLQQEHHGQRTALLAMVDECDKRTKSNADLADDARWLIESLRKDMDREDVEFERLAPEVPPPATSSSQTSAQADRCS
jgi:hypothetical protein